MKSSAYQAALHAWILESERQLRACERWQPEGSAAEYTLFLPAPAFLSPASQLKLQAVNSEKHWQQMFELRMQIEAAYGLDQPEIVEQLVADIRYKQKHLQGQWYLARVAGQWVGEIGLVPSECLLQGQRVRLGRLQDVDILPAYQGQGYGHQLLAAICQQALAQGLAGLGLMALQEDWPAQWYQRLGFERVGQVAATEPRF